MYCIKKIAEDLIWVGANDRRLAMFEGVYSVPNGVSYNSYILRDEKNVLFDTVDKAVTRRFFENVEQALEGEKLDYLIVQHMEPDHSAAIPEIISRYPGLKIVCNKKTSDMMKQFCSFDVDSHSMIVTENDVLNTGKHSLHFVMAPMVHWPEVMVTYDSTAKILFSADAFGSFGALNGALFADEVDFAKDYMDEARRYYTNIVGKYGAQTQAILNKAAALDIALICPLHGFIWRKNLNEFISKYELWSTYKPEEYGVMVAYASIYGNTENAAEILACRLRDKGIKTVMFDVSVTPASEIVAASFRWSHLVFASTTYNAGIFVTMEAFISDLAAHNIQNRTVAVIENGSWAPTSGNLIIKKLSECKNINILENKISIKSSLKKEQLDELYTLADAIIDTMPDKPAKTSDTAVVSGGGINADTMFKISYGLFVLTVRDGEKDNGCIINTAAQITVSPIKISVAVNKTNYTCDMILKTGEFNVSVLTESTPFSIFEQFGFSSGKDNDKFSKVDYSTRTANGIRYIPEHTNSVISAKVIQTIDLETHILFIAEVTQATMLSDEPSTTYQYYFDHIKPKPPIQKESKKGYVCKICGYVYEGENLPDDFICPLCKHGAEDFEKL